MPLLPLRGLPVNDNHDGPLSIRVEVRASGSAQVFVRRESDKKTWVCRVRSLQEILAPTQRARPLDVAAVVTCLYNGVAYDSTSSSAYSSMPQKLVRREVAFTQPETWTDGGYRLTMRVAVRSSAIAIPAILSSVSNGSVEAVPVVDGADDDVVFGLNFTPTDVDLDHSKTLINTARSYVSVKLNLADPAFANSYLNWSRSPDRDTVKSVDDGIFMIRDGTRYRPKTQTLVTLDILHAKEPVAFAFSVDSRAMPAIHTTTYQSQPGGDLHRTITQYVLKVPAMSFVQVVLLPGSACALEGTSITFREQPMDIPSQFNVPKKTNETAMPLLALRPLPVNDNHEGPLTIRIETRISGSVYVYVRREADKKTWLCKVQSLQEILAPTQQARALDIVAVITCLYHGVAYDDSASTSSYSTLPVELHRKEVAFSQPETWTDGGYRLTMRVTIRSAAMAVSAPHTTGDHSHVAEAIPVGDVVEDDDVVFGLNFKPTDVDISHKPAKKQSLKVEKRTGCLRSSGVVFANAFINWQQYKDRDFLRVDPDGVLVVGYEFQDHNVIEVTLDIVHAKRPALWLLSVNSSAVQPAHTTTYQNVPGGDLHHTIAQYVLRMPTKGWLQVAMLPGSAAALEGTSVTVRETAMAQ